MLDWKGTVDLEGLHQMAGKFLSHLDEDDHHVLLQNSSENCQHWGVTGASGWLGRHIARHFLRQGKTVTLFTRAEDEKKAFDLCWGALVPLGNEKIMKEAAIDDWKNRVLVKGGAFDKTTDFPQVDAIFHAAANTSWIQPFPQSTLYQLWNDLWVCFWAQSVGARRIDVAGTQSIWVHSKREGGVCFENDPIAMSEQMHGVYAANKWAQDCFFQGAMLKMSCKISIHRLGLLLMSRDEGWSKHCPVGAVHAASKINGFCAQSASLNPSLNFDWSPTDLVIESIMSIINSGGDGVFAHNSDQPMSYLVWSEALSHVYGRGSWILAEHKQAYRALGRTISGNTHPHWADLFQMDRHTLDRERAKKWGAPSWSAPGQTELIDMIQG